MASPILTVDTVIEFPSGEVVFIKRGIEPFKGRWALPGGHVDIGETVEAAAIREVKEETGLEVKLDRLVGVYSDPKRDPRGDRVTVVFHAVPVGGELYPSSDAEEVIKAKDFVVLKLAFDHSQIVKEALSVVKK